MIKFSSLSLKFTSLELTKLGHNSEVCHGTTVCQQVAPIAINIDRFVKE